MDSPLLSMVEGSWRRALRGVRVSRAVAALAVAAAMSRAVAVAAATLAVGVLACGALGVLASTAWAGSNAFGIASFTTSSSSSQAGAHADFTASFALSAESLGNPIDQLENVQVRLPEGLVGSPQAIPKCSDEQFADFACPANAQVGLLMPSFIICRGVATTLTGVVAPTTLAATAKPEEPELTLASTEGIEAGDTLMVGTGPTSETVIVLTVIDSTHVSLLYGLRGRTYPEGTPVADDTIAVANTAGFCASSSENVITIGSGGSAQTASIAYVTNATHLTLEEPLSGVHTPGEPVSYHAHPIPVPIPLFNLQATPGHLATLGASFLIGTFLLQVEFQTGSGYQLTATMNDISTLLTVQAASIILWGVPGETAHNRERCGQIGFPCDIAVSGAPAPFLSNPTNCSQPMTSTLTVDPWQDPEQQVTQTASQSAPTGCAELQISPALSVTPETTRRDSPSGYEVDLKSPQNESPYGLAAAALRTVSIELPEGTSLSPAAANGLQGCSDAQFASGACPGASKVGSVSIASPLLPETLLGSVYLADPTPAEPYRVFVTAAAGDLKIDLTGQIETNPDSGRLTVVFAHLPELPLSELHIDLFGGPSAALANPAACGPATSTSQVLAYGGQVAAPSSSFVVDADGGGGACQSSPPFAPNFTAGTSTPFAGDFSPFTLTVSREDGQQSLSTIAAQLPPGMLAMVSRVQQCGEPQAARGECGAVSQIGAIALALGAGSQPLYLAGRVYLTGPYEGAPFGLSIVVPASAGPFDLGTIVLRAQVSVDPQNLQLAILTNSLPQIVQGIPLRLRMVELSVDRPEFIFNSTDCAPQTILATIASTEGASSALDAPYDLHACGELPFAPKLSATAQAARSRSGDGASLGVRIALAPGQANLRSLRVQLPRPLRARPSTILQACPQATFSTAPSACPAGSLVGSGTVSTPVLAGPLSGPVYLLANGPGAPPKLVATLREQNIVVDVSGTLTISKSGVASVAFQSVPDAPISSLSLDFPRGPHSLLGVNGSLCAKALRLPFALTGQNGDQVKRVARLKASACAVKRNR
jgi:hypothetical protein